MSDDDKFQRRPGTKPTGFRGRKNDAGKPAFADKKKPSAMRSGKGADGERPKRDFKRADRPRDGFAKPYPPREERRPRPEGDERPKRDFGGDRKPSGGFKPRPRPAEASEETGERIAKRLARAGIASRRDAEELIAAGRIKVNGKILGTPAFNVTQSDIIYLDGMEIPPIERTRLFLFHKPAGVVTTNRDPEGRKTVFDVLPSDLPRLMTVGRLDINTEGLLLLTNDGGLSRVLELPATGWLRRYRVRVHGKVEESALASLREGIAVDGVFYGAVEASLDREQGSNAWLTIGLREGKNREVKNILGALGLDVTRLIRVSYGPFQLNELPEGHVLEIRGRMLRDQLGERLVEESGANFDADIVRPFSNKPVRRVEPRAEEAPRPKGREGGRAPIGEGGLIKRRKFRENSRDEALGKLSTRPERGFGERGGKPERGGLGGKPGFRKADRDRPPLEPPGQRKANVWMAPGARPPGKDRVEANKAEADTLRDRKPGHGRSRDEKSYGKPRGDRPNRGGDRPFRKGPGKGPKAR
jgi:23S rRNA pseudouridine2605 synthase